MTGATVAAPTWRNWAGNESVAATAVAHPTSTAEVVEVIRAAAGAGRPVKAVGNGHSFTAAAVTDGVRVELDQLSGVVAVEDVTDRAARVTVRGGTPLRVLNALLAERGLAMPNLGDIDAQTITGAVSTGTHGTGAAFGCLATFIESLELVTGSGEVIRCSADDHPEIFAAARVGIGALGVITEVTLRVDRAFTLRAEERPAALADVLRGLDEWVDGNDHFEFFWFPYTDRAQTKTNNRVPTDDQPLSRFRGWLDDDFLSNTVFGGACRLGRAVPALTPAITGFSARALSPRVYTGRSDRVFCTARRVKFMEMEYGLPREALPEAFAALQRLLPTLPHKVIFPVEVRFTAADDIWLSHGYGRQNAYIAVHQYIGMPYEPYFRGLEQICVALGGRPHWGKKHFRTASSLARAYPRFDDFLAVRDRLDPDRVFANDYTRQVLGG